MSTMRAVILAAENGLGSGSAAGAAPKCLLRLGDRTLLERQITGIRAIGIDDVTVVVGCQSDLVRRQCGHHHVHFVDNLRFAQTSSLYSLWLTRPLLLDGFVVLKGDVLFHPRLLDDLVTAPCEDALLVAFADESRALGSAETKVKVRGGRVVDISKEMDPGKADGEHVGMAKFGAAGARLLVNCLDALVAAGHSRDSAPRSFRCFARRRRLETVGTRGYPWIAIDRPEDRERAEREVLPAIEQLPEPAPVAGTAD